MSLSCSSYTIFIPCFLACIGLKITCVPQVPLHTLKTCDYACSLPDTCTCKFPDVPYHNACKITRSSCRLCLQYDPSNVPLKLPAVRVGLAFRMTRQMCL